MIVVITIPPAFCVVLAILATVILLNHRRKIDLVSYEVMWNRRLVVNYVRGILNVLGERIMLEVHDDEIFVAATEQGDKLNAQGELMYLPNKLPVSISYAHIRLHRHWLIVSVNTLWCVANLITILVVMDIDKRSGDYWSKIGY